MASFRVIPIHPDVARTVRDTRISPFAHHPTFVETARGYGPCRLCLQAFEVGQEPRILFTYDPFQDLARFPLPGPVFIHETECDPFPADGGFPASMRGRGVTLVGYSEDALVRCQERVTDGDPEEAIERVLARWDVHYIHVRDTDAGCYDFRVEPTIKSQRSDST